MDPENRRIFNLENEIWQQAEIHTRPYSYNADQAWQKISQRLSLKENVSRDIILLNKSQFRLFVAAASLIFLIMLGGISFQLFRKASVQQQLKNQTIISSNIGEKSHIFLSDSTEVFLNSKSMLSFGGSFNIRDREIYLSGEAFFNVSSNAQKPFVVNIDKLQITATGTRFNVSGYNDDNRIEATLEEGHIYVSVEEEKKIYMKAGEQLVYYRDSKEVVLHQVLTNTYTAWKENELRFMDAPLEEVMRKIGRKFNVDIEIENQQISNLKYTATFIDESIEEILQMLKMVSPIDYKIYKHPSAKDEEYRRPKIVISAKNTFVQEQTNVKPN